ncbi:MAG: DUF4389 domain-containing protein [Wenzhouxiangella sp.]
MEERTRKALSDKETWLRAPVLLLFYFLLVLVTPVLMLVSVVGWFALLIRGHVPGEISDLGRQLAAWLDQTARYLTGGASRRPFPFEDLDCPADKPASHVAGPTVRKPAANPGRSPTVGTKAESTKKATKKTGKKKVSKKKAGKKAAGKKKKAPASAETVNQPVTKGEVENNE